MRFGLNPFGKKKKRIPYDPPGSKARKKANKQANRRVDQLFVTRRAVMMKSAVIGAFSVLLARLGYMQIGKGGDYQAAATTNITDWRELKPSRGVIVDRKGRMMAKNRKSWSVSVIPADIRQLESTQLAYVREQLMTALRLPDVVMINPGSIPAEAKDQVYRRVGRLLGDTTEQDYQNTKNWIKAQLRFNDYAKFDDISADTAAQFNTYQADLPGVEIVNFFDYVIRNYRYIETPYLLKTDISREVAMKLAANQLYLPGVVLSDEVLTRQYPGGPTMSHILGFAGPVNSEELNDDSNVSSRDEDGNPQYRFYKPGDIIGKQGLEYFYEEQLRGGKGGYLYERDSNGRELRRLTEGATPAVAGRNLQLTVDVELQAAVSQILQQELPLAMQRRQEADAKASVPYTEHTTQGGAVVIFDVNTGEVLAMASYPTYDNTLFVEGISERKYKELRDDIRGPLYDKCYMQKYPPGSVIKPFMALTGMREKVIDVNTQFFCGGGIKVPYDFDESKGNIYGCWAKAGHGAMAVEKAIEQSCDVFFYNVGVSAGQRRPENGKVNHYFDFSPASQVQGEEHSFSGLGINKIHAALTKRFWFGRITGIDLPVETAGLVGSVKWLSDNYEGAGWSIGDTVNASIGQGYIEFSPLQLALNTAALCNGGNVYRPRIVHSVVDADGNVLQEFAPVIKRKIKFNQDQLTIVLNGMHDVVHNLSGTAFADPTTGKRKFSHTNPDGEEEIQIGGKTGTAEFQKGVDAAGDPVYDAHAWFSMFAPFDKPEISISVFIESGGEGSTNAVPIADKAARAYFELTGRRKRGMILREDGEPVGDKVASPLDDPNAGKLKNATPAATPEANPGQ
jgi:penicillin-binding protein 2